VTVPALHSELPTPSLAEAEFAELGRRARWHIIKTVAERGAGHVGGPLSATDLLVALYFGVLRIDHRQPAHPERDRFILSKGHSAIGLYAVLALRGYLPVDELASFDEGDSRLQAHPDVTRLPGLDASTGSLGQGLSYGIGLALSARLSQRDFHTWVMLGDGEVQEGMVWEAMHVAPRYNLSNLTAIVDLNGLQQYGWEATPASRADRGDPWPGVDLRGAFSALGWRVLEVDGHDFDDIMAVLASAKAQAHDPRPAVVLAHTIKGKGFSFSEGRARWHNGIATPDELDQAWHEICGDELEGLER
jgi:transketolase